MGIVDRLRAAEQEIRDSFGHHPHADTLASMADQWAGRDIAAEDRAATPQVPIAESVDLDAAEAQVTADAAADADLPPAEATMPAPAEPAPVTP